MITINESWLKPFTIPSNDKYIINPNIYSFIMPHAGFKIYFECTK